MSKLKIGDKVIWRGAWGSEAPQEATIEQISLCAVGSKYGKDVKSVDWKTIEAGKVVVTLNNGHWAYGHQLTEIKKKDNK
jgi:hypothetical protein